MGADRIFAEPGTLTGSIGVTGGKFVVSGLMEKLGVTTDTIAVGKNGTLNSMNQPFSETERAAMKKLMDDTYHQFVAKAAQGRKMTFEQLDKLAGGRVYTGRQAQKLGLIDEVGTLEDALASARQLANLPDDAKPELLVLPKAQGFLEALIGPLEDRDTYAPSLRSLPFLPDEARSILAKLDQFRRVFAKEPVAVMLPYDLRVH
jgi:protease-4